MHDNFYFSLTLDNVIGVDNDCDDDASVTTNTNTAGCY